MAVFRASSSVHCALSAVSAWGKAVVAHARREEQPKQTAQRHGQPAQQIAAPQRLQGGRLGNGVAVKLRGVAAGRGAKDVDQPAARDKLPAALLIQRALLLGQREVVVKEGGGGQLDAVAQLLRLAALKRAQKSTPPAKLPALCGHIAIAFFVFPNGVVARVDEIPSHVCSSSAAPSCTMCLRRRYSTRRASSPFWVMA